MLQAGVGIQQALTALQKSAPRVMRPTVAQICAEVQQGWPFTDAMARHLRAFPELDHQILAIAEKSGAMDKALLSLANFHTQHHQAQSRAISSTILPALNLVAAIFVCHLPKLIVASEGPEYTIFHYLRDTVGFLIGIVALIAAILILFRQLLRWPATALATDFFVRKIPLIGSLRFNYVLSQWIEAIRLMLNAGYGVLDAMKQANTIIRSPILQYAYAKMEPQLHHQLGVSEAMGATGIFPDMLIQYWSTGEQSGKMDEMLLKLSKFYEEVWQKSLNRLATWLPRIIYGLVALFIAFQIIKFFLAYMHQIDEATKGF